MQNDEIVRYPPGFLRDFPDLGTTAGIALKKNWSRKIIFRGSQHMKVPPALKTTAFYFLRRYRR